ncbi:Hypothetical protein ABZS17H1_02974 [Kosakonia cowanii]
MLCQKKRADEKVFHSLRYWWQDVRFYNMSNVMQAGKG